MNSKLIHLKPKLVYRLWGNDKLQNIFNDASVEHAGEAWIVSALAENSSTIKETNQDFLDFFNNNRSFFDNYENKAYPLLTKIIATSQDLSIQVHPGDNYAQKFNSLGKTECWYIIDSQNGYIYLDSDKSTLERVNAIETNKTLDVLDKVEVKEGDFYFIPAQKIHAIGKNVVLFELQQSSDITFRIDDFNRIDKQTNQKRELHLKDAVNALMQKEKQIESKQDVSNVNNQILTDNEYFTLHKILNKASQDYIFDNARWIQIYVVKGSGSIDEHQIVQNDSIILKSGYNNFRLKGNVEIMLSYLKK